MNKNFWTRGYCVSTVGLDEKQIREYIKNQEKLDQDLQGELNFNDIDFFEKTMEISIDFLKSPY